MESGAAKNNKKQDGHIDAHRNYTPNDTCRHREEPALHYALFKHCQEVRKKHKTSISSTFETKYRLTERLIRATYNIYNFTPDDLEILRRENIFKNNLSVEIERLNNLQMQQMEEYYKKRYDLFLRQLEQKQQQENCKQQQQKNQEQFSQQLQLLPSKKHQKLTQKIQQRENNQQQMQQQQNNQQQYQNNMQHFLQQFQLQKYNQHMQPKPTNQGQFGNLPQYYSQEPKQSATTSTTELLQPRKSTTTTRTYLQTQALKTLKLSALVDDDQKKIGKFFFYF